jgi:hypothetical protein
MGKDKRFWYHFSLGESEELLSRGDGSDEDSPNLGELCLDNLKLFLSDIFLRVLGLGLGGHESGYILGEDLGDKILCRSEGISRGVLGLVISLDSSASDLGDTLELSIIPVADSGMNGTILCSIYSTRVLFS